ncbi:MAG: stage III sporulation protein AA [Anaeromicrobium sp.]|jgi:stage III sporulation protein AA|uniref:stage III sporulation protein AA n=1 Tax=Anaeromicrobium sp. TaxID=1929132 RepID=UPI0025D34EE3|nr:stage III sporulation protein AA [Anaeromicrobium sp.]MCT4596165.1 stage III sporulation protein AA [Anaeromicrobium sp.]
MNFSKDNNFYKKVKNLPHNVLEIFPLNIRDILLKISEEKLNGTEEIRLRTNRPLIINKSNRDFLINSSGHMETNLNEPYLVSKEDILKTYQLVTDYSIYAFEEDIKNGFITLKNGHRVGICGRVVFNRSGIQTIQDISGLNIRIAHEKVGVSNFIIKYLINNSTDIYNTLIISPPQCGKTTLLRDIIRNLSNGIETFNYIGTNVGVVDERSEICAMYKGIPQNNIGIRTDVLDACPKAEGIFMLLRSMSPNVIATDEIGKKEDVQAIKSILNAGVKVITTIHGYDVDDIKNREHVGELIEKSIFQRILVLTNNPKVGTVKEVIDGSNMSKIYNFIN